LFIVIEPSQFNCGSCEFAEMNDFTTDLPPEYCQYHDEGCDAVSGSPIITEVFSWEQMDYFCDRTKQVTDRNIGTLVAGQALGGAYLRKAEIDSHRGMIWACQLRSAII
jgi:hypothetical protein